MQPGSIASSDAARRAMGKIELDWQIESDAREVSAAAGEPDPPVVEHGESTELTASTGSRLRRTLVVLLAILGMAALATTAILAHKADEITAPIEKAILANYNAMQFAIAEDDSELFASFVSRNNSTWRQWQQDMYSRHALVDRSPFGLYALGQSPQVVDVGLAPDLSRAVLTAEHAYTFRDEGGAIHTTRLRQTTAFSYIDQEWLMTAPDSAFWGQSLSHHTSRLTVRYPERDSDLSERLAVDLEADLEALCAHPYAFECPANFRVDLQLDTRSAALIELFNPDDAGMLAAAPHGSARVAVSLPTPTLVGLPVGEASYQALRRGYTRQLARALAAMTSELQDPWAIQWIGSMALEKQMIQSGLRPWPAQLDQPDQDVLNGLLPDQDIVALCAAGSNQDTSLLRYSLDARSWSTAIDRHGLISYAYLPAYDGLLLTQRPDLSDIRSTRVLWLQDSREQLVYDSASETEYVYSVWPASTRTALLALIADVDSFRGSSYVLFDPERCKLEECSLGYEIFGYPLWSPDASRTLLQSGDGSLYLANAQGQSPVLVDAGYMPVWLDDETFVYTGVQRGSDAQRSFDFMMSRVGEDQPQVMLAGDDLRAALPERVLDAAWSWAQVYVNPANTQQFLIAYYSVHQPNYAAAFMSAPEVNYLMYDRGSGDVSLRLTATFPGESVSYLPGGEGLMQITRDVERLAWWVRFSNSNLEYHLSVHDPQTDLPTSIEWSDDHRWVIILADGVLHVLSPIDDRHLTIVPESPGCNAATWVNSK